ncbi:MAG: GntR family transcriptional regulator [Clostridia bacterium]|nr:GntR family transcriptional regulator [Clostridia bacterium]
MRQESFELVEENKPIRDVAYETLKHAIITGKLPAGAHIVETAYAEQLHISRTPLREALRRLEHDGLVAYEVRRGVVVRAFTIEDVEEIFMIRNAMMMLILPSIVERVTEKDLKEMREILADMDIAMAEGDCEAIASFNRAFHSKMEHLTDKNRIVRVIDDQEEYITRFSSITIANIQRRETAHQEHHKIVELLEKRDLEGLRALMAHHLQESKETCLVAVKKHVF